MAARILARNGYQIREAGDGPTAVRVARGALDKAGAPRAARPGPGPP